MASAISSITGVDTSNSSSSTASSSQTAPSEQMFLQLLVSQLQNQDPLNPADSTQFIAELAQFSQLEQVIGIHGDLDSIMSTTATIADNTAKVADSSTTKDTTGQTSTTGSIKS